MHIHIHEKNYTSPTRNIANHLVIMDEVNRLFAICEENGIWWNSSHKMKQDIYRQISDSSGCIYPAYKKGFHVIG